MDTKRLGNLGELKALTKFAEYSIPVFIPYGENERVDLLADFNNKIQRIQVKSSSTIVNGAISFNIRSTTVNSVKTKIHQYTSDEIDYFVLYSKVTDTCYIIPIEEAPTSIIMLRVTPPANGQIKGIRMEYDYTLDKFLTNLGYNKN